MYFTEHIVTSTLIFQSTKRATSDKFSTNKRLPDHAIKTFLKNPYT